MVHRSDGNRQLIRDILGLIIWVIAIVGILAFVIGGFVMVLGSMA